MLVNVPAQNAVMTAERRIYMLENLKDLSVSELESLKNQIEIEIAQRSGNKHLLHLSYNQYKGSGKCWVARINPETKKILGFVDAESVQKDGNYKGEKTYELIDGNYLSCESGSKSTDNRTYFQIKDGEYSEL